MYKSIFPPISFSMDLISIVLLGIVQGITEWIPLSSKTQDTIAYLSFFHGDPASVIAILLYLHIGTVLAATVYFRGEIAKIVIGFVKSPADLHKHASGELGFLFTSLLFTGAVGLPLLLIEMKVFSNFKAGGLLYAVMGAGLMVTGIFLLTQKGVKARNKENASWRDGILTGLLQGLSVLPGVSRSGTSTTALILRGFDSESSFHLSFLLSIPTVIFAELVFYIGGNLKVFPVVDGVVLALSSFIIGYLTLDTLLKAVRRVNLAYIALALGVVIVFVGLLGAG